MKNREYLIKKLDLPRDTADYYLITNGFVCAEIPDGECACEMEWFDGNCRLCQERWLGATHNTQRITKSSSAARAF